MAFKSSRGKISHLRINDLGHVWGPADDALHTEVVVVVDSAPEMAFGFELRTGDDNLPARLAMLALLREALMHDITVSLSYDIAEGKKQGHLRRVDIQRS